MKCPKCESVNREGVKFCEECGAKFELVCPSCKAKIPLGKKFCGECGKNLTPPSEQAPTEFSFDQKIEKIQKYLPEGLTEKILSQKDRIEGERKQVTVMFCDMEGFTPLSEMLGIEEAYTIIDKIYEILIHKVHDYEGTVNEMTGDGIMALFGAPVALEDAPQRAIRSSLSIHREMAKFSDTLKQEKKDVPPLKMRIGIHTGPVVVGTVGNDLRVEFKAVGDTVNLASRMEGQAQPGTTYVTDDVFKLTEGFFRFEALGEKDVKGKKKPIKVYRAIAPSTRRTRFDVSAERGLTPFVGRERELEILLDGFERAKGGRGQAFSIMAEAGVGKSRLLYEFRKIISNENVTFLEGKSLPYNRGRAYHPVIDILKSNFDIHEEDGNDEITRKVSVGIRKLGVEEKSTVPYILEFLSVVDSDIDKVTLNPETRKGHIIKALRRIVIGGSEIRPLIMAFEDLHWIDKSSEDILKDLLDNISGARVFLIFTYRPEFVHTWGGKSYHNQLNLNRMSNRESLTMLGHYLGTDKIDKNIEELILEKTEGIPLYIEEFVKSLIEQKIIGVRRNEYTFFKDIREITVPSTIQDVIMSRVDSLPETAKRILQTGSVIGREFSQDLIQELTKLPERDLISYLSASKDSELIYESGIYPQSRYIFKHALTQEVTYNSLLSKKRKEIHQEIGKTIESLYSHRLDELYEVVAYHYSNSTNYEKAIHYLEMAGDKAARMHSLEVARQHYQNALTFLEKSKELFEYQKKYITLTLKWAEVSQYAPSHRIRNALKVSLKYAQELGSEGRVGDVYYWVGRFAYMQGDFNETLPQVERCITWSKDLKNKELLALSYNLKGRSCLYIEKYKKGIEFLEKGLNLIKPYWKYDDIVYSGAFLGLIYGITGQFDNSKKAIENAIEVAKKHEILIFEAMAYGYLGTIHFLYGQLQETIDYCSTCVDISKKLGNPLPIAWSSFFKGAANFNFGKEEHGLKLMREGIEFLKSTDSVLALRYFYSLLAECLAIKGDSIEAESMNQKALSLDQYGQKWGEIINYRTKAIINANETNPDWKCIDSNINKSILLAEKKGALPDLVTCYFRYSELLRQKGDNEKSEFYREKRQAIAEQIGIRI
jgi:class 3 adenylate cyclase/tetratricopeptide (TPR) repeat protein